LGLRNTIWFYSTALDVIAIDQVTKALARLHLVPGKPVPVIRGFFDLKLDFNTGAAFGVLPNWAPLFILVGLVAIYAIVRLKRTGTGSLCLSIGLGMLLGGAIGNLIDRVLFSSRGVTDFLDLHIKSGQSLLSWPTFNFADAGIVIGAILVVIHVYVIEKRRPEPGDEQVPDDENHEQQTQA
jgi:signal peptidase II